MGNHFVTIKDIAKALGISVSTVSRALRDTYDINGETKDKILQMASDMNYKPNLNAIGLAKGRAHNIGIILPFITNYYFSTAITGIQEVAYSKGYNIILFITNDSPEREISIIQNLVIPNLSGLLVSTSSDSSACEHLLEVIDHDIPVVFFDRAPSGIHVSKVMQDDYNGAFEATEHLIKNDYSKIAHIAGPVELSFTKNRLDGYLSALNKYNIPFRKEWIIHSGFSQEWGGKDVSQLLECKNVPDAIFAVNDRKAIGAMLELKQRNINVGRDMGIVGFTNDPISTIISPQLTTIAEPAYNIGKISCELLLKHIAKKNFEPEEIIIPGKLIVRESSIRK